MTMSTSLSMVRSAIPAALALILAGCAAGPDYHRPELPVAQHYVEASTQAQLQADRLVAPAELPAHWWALYR